MSESELDSEVADVEDDEGKLYQYIYEMNTTEDNREETEKVQVPSSSGHTPEHLEINAERRTQADGTTEGLDMAASKNIQGHQKLNPKLESVDKKPWRKSGVDISDYFNYGFDEETWNTYWKKQQKLFVINRKLDAKIKAQRGHTGYGKEESSCAHSSSGRPSLLASRGSNSTIDGIRRHPGYSYREERGRCLNVGGNNIQVVTEMSHKEDRITAHHLPPPPSVSPVFALIPPRPWLPRPSHPSSSATLDKRHTKYFDGPSTSLYPCSSGNMAISAGVIDTAKAWEWYIQQEDRHQERVQFRKHGHDKGRGRRSRGRNREQKGCSSSHNRREEQMKHRDPKEGGHQRRNFERVGGEGWQSSKRTGSDGEGRSSRRKTAKKSKDKKSSKMFSADQERKLKSD